MTDAQTATGSVLSWGAGDAGQLGNGTSTDSYSPASVTSLLRADVDQLVSGGVDATSGFVLARTGRSVKSWGDNVAGQLGNGGTTDHAVPETVPRLSNIKDIAAGGMHALALDTSGQVYSWGDNPYGQIGNNRTGDHRTTPDRVLGMPKVQQIAAGSDFSLALLENGKVYAWGRGIHGQLGNGSRATSSVPRQVTGLEGIAAIAAGGHHALALTADGTVKSWGYNLYGQLGNSSNKSSTVPVDVDLVEDVSTIIAGAHHNYAITSNGTVWGWGNNHYGQLLKADENFDTNVSRTNRTTPVEIARLKDAQSLTAGPRHGAAIIGGKVVTWGNNEEGQLGNGTTTSAYVEVNLTATGYTKVTTSLGSNTTYLH
ncbi:sialidase [Kitasatospora purpeofusca]|uniref:RCC1 domain-containing protein n=1 Tax=Kitasatospora purpeofusca TaxID=67352 RepID=UPI002A5A8608|nr:sialidase [Kitasatospora purpeofusca]MDY0816077.1 sialidase [Kitasatospora purpeofusca]